MRILPIALTAALLAFSAQAALAQTLTARNSTLTYSYVYGAGGDSHSGNDNIPDTTLLASDTEQTETSGSTSGTLPGDPPSPYSAGVSCDLSHEFAITGPLTAFRRINASASSESIAAASGAGLALMNSDNPGNQLELYFTVTTPMQYNLVGSIAATEPGFATGVVLQVFDGFVWQSIFNSILLPGSQGPFNVAGTLNPGQYRISAFLAADAFGNETATSSYQYELRLAARADMNCDGKIDGLDIQAFADALLALPAYTSNYPHCNPLNGDFNNDTAVTTADVAPFTQCVLTGGCP